MTVKIRISLLALVVCLNGLAQQPVNAEYTGIEYIQLKAELNKGWNTWNTNSVLSHVLLPEAISVDFYLKDKSTGKILTEALMGRRGKDAESILPLAHTNDGSYTELEIKWNGIELKVQSSAVGKNICFLLTPIASNANGEILVSPHKNWWDRDGKVSIEDNQLIYDLPSGMIKLFTDGKPISKNDSDSLFLAFYAGSEIALSTEGNLSVLEVREKIARAKAIH